jgi:hypothetical protein
MSDDYDELFRAAPPPSYWEALRTIAGQLGVDVCLLDGSRDRNEPPHEALFYIKLARALLSEARADPADIWISAKAGTAISVIDKDLGPLIKEFARRRPVESINGRSAEDVVSNAIGRALLAEAVLTKYSDIPRRKPGRPPEFRGNSVHIYNLMIEARLDFSLPWRKSRKQLENHVENKSNRLSSMSDRRIFRRKMNELLGSDYQRAREVYRTVKERAAKIAELIPPLSP